MAKTEYVYVAYHRMSECYENITFIDGVFDSEEKEKKKKKSAYRNPVYDEDKDIWKLSGRDEFVHIGKI